MSGNNRLIGLQLDLLGGGPTPIYSRTGVRPPAERPAPGRRGRRRAEECASKAERVTSWDREAVRALWLRLLAGHDMTGEQLTDAAMDAGHRPHDARAFGAVMSSLARAGKIRSIGIVERRKGHGTAGARVWRLV